MFKRWMLVWGCLAVFPVVHAQVPGIPAPGTPTVATTGERVPLLSLDTIHFLEGTWTATSRDGRVSLGNYRFVRELDGHVLARESSVDPRCVTTEQPECRRHDLFYVFQDSPGAPLRAIAFDSEGHVLRYFVYLSVQASTSTMGKREFVIFDSDTLQLGPHVRLRYEHSVDTVTGKDALNGAFEMMQPDGKWAELRQWYGTRQ